MQKILTSASGMSTGTSTKNGLAIFQAFLPEMVAQPPPVFQWRVLLWLWSRQRSWAKLLVLGKHSGRTVGLKEGVNPVCGFCLLFSWANSCHNLKTYEYVLQAGIWQFTDWSSEWGAHRGPRDAAVASLFSWHCLHQPELMHILRLYSLTRKNLFGLC